jgi:hypothetical protein
MQGESFHDLPVYRLTQDAYHEERDAYLDKHVQSIFPGQLSSKQAKRLRENLEGHLYDVNGPWRFNEIVGYVRLHFVSGQVRGEYFGVNKKRLVLTRKKTLVWNTFKLAPEIDIPRDADSAGILQTIIEYVDACRKELPRRFIDDEWLRTVGPYVDWLSLWKAGW